MLHKEEAEQGKVSELQRRKESEEIKQRKEREAEKKLQDTNQEAKITHEDKAQKNIKELKRSRSAIERLIFQVSQFFETFNFYSN